MALQVDQINTELASFVRRLDFDKLPLAQVEGQFAQLSSQMSQLGTQVGEVTGGFMSLTQELDVPPEVLSETLSSLEAATASFTDGAAYNLQEELGNIKGVVNRGIVMLAENPPGLNIQNAVSSLNSDLEAITGSSIGGGFNNIVVTANTPEAMAKAMSNVAGVPLSQAQSALQSIVPQINSLQNNIGSLLGNLQNNLPAIEGLSEQINSFLGNVNEILNVTSSAKGLLNDVVENLSGSIKSNIRGLLSVNANLPDDILKQALPLVQARSFEEAAALLSTYSDLSIDDLTDQLSQISTNVGGEVVSSTAANNDPTEVISPTQNPQRPNQPITQSSVVYGIISSVDRDVTELVFRTVSFSHPETGLSPGSYSNYHLIVQADGTINRSAALNAQLDVPGHEQYSIGIIVAAKNGRVTAEQTAAIDRIMKAFFAIIPYGQIINYSDIDGVVRPDLIFDFTDYAVEHFNYSSILSEPTSSLSTEQIQLRIRAASTLGVPHVDDVI